jgi:hypothetical protein
MAERLESMSCDPFAVLAAVAIGELPCGLCRGVGKTHFQPMRGRQKEPKERTCGSCYGSGRERISPGERLKAASELAQYCEPKLKAVEHSSAEGAPPITSIQIHLIEAENGRPKYPDQLVLARDGRPAERVHA